MIVPTTAPHSRRLSFRRATGDDLATLHEHWNDVDVRRYLWDDAPVARETVHAVLSASEADFARAGFGLWIVAAPPAAFAGVCGLRRVDGSDDVEVLYSLAPPCGAAASRAKPHGRSSPGPSRTLRSTGSSAASTHRTSLRAACWKKSA